MTGRHSLYLLLIGTGAVIIGGSSIDKLWNLLPLLTTFTISETIIYAGGNKWEKLAPTLRYTSAGLILGTAVVSLTFHLAWEFRVVKPGAGFAGWQIFWFIPIIASASGCIGGLTGFIFGNYRRKHTT